MAASSGSARAADAGVEAASGGHARLMEIAALILASLSALATAVLVVWLLVWGARKDGQEDDATQRRLGIRRRTRLGR